MGPSGDFSFVAGRGLVITGGFGVLGRALGKAAQEAGAHVALLGRGQPPNDVTADFVMGDLSCGFHSWGLDTTAIWA